MRKLVLLAVSAALAAAWWAVARLSPPFLLGGIQVNEADPARWVTALGDAGMNAVAVTVYARQGDWDSANLWFADDEPGVVNEVREARRAGLDVVLVLRVALDHAFPRNKFYWHGMIVPRTETELDAWFERYRRFVLRWAEIAEREGITVLAIGSEMNSMTNTVPVDALPELEEYYANRDKVGRENAKIVAHEDAIARRNLWVRGYDPAGSVAEFLDERSTAERDWARRVAYLDEPDPVERINQRRRRLDAAWRDLIAATRRRYGGRLTYAANFDRYEFVGFWDDLDLIAVNAYFPLLHHYLPDIGRPELAALLESRWEAQLARLDAFRRRIGLPRRRFLFTELGYSRRAHSTIEPWNSHGFSVLPSPRGETLVVWEEQPIDLEERALAVRGLYRANLRFDLLAGLLYWKLSTEPTHTDIEPFALVLGAGDPMQTELARFSRARPRDRLLYRVFGRLPGR
jgi:Glycoside Hydrolase Family 113